MSDIPLAREYLHTGLQTDDKARKDHWMRRALAEMTRVAPINRAPAGPNTHITADQKRQARHLRRTTDMTQHDVAKATGIPNAGRISEIEHGQR